MKIERLESLPRWEVREFYFTYLKLPYHKWEEKDHVPHPVDETIETVWEIYHPLDDRPSGIVILRDELVLDFVDVKTGEYIRLTIGEMRRDDAEKQRNEMLVQLALLDSATISKDFAEIVTHLERKQYRVGRETFRDLNQRVTFLGTILDTMRKSATSRAKLRSEKRRMAETTLQTVLVLDTATQCYQPVAHNLGPSWAVEVADAENDEGKIVRIIDQEKHHRAADASKCKRCKEMALRFTGGSAEQPGAGSPTGTT